MKTQNLLTTVRLMTYTILLSLFAFTASVYAVGNDNYILGGGEDSESAENVERVELEEWMLEEKHFKIESKVRNSISESHPLENWMIKGNFQINENSVQEQIGLEDWMLDRSNFKISKGNTLEPWMMNRRCFITDEEKEFESIKNWMVNREFFKI